MIIGIREYSGSFPEGAALYDIVYRSDLNKTFIYLDSGWTEHPYEASTPDVFIPRDGLTRSAYIGRDWNTFVAELLAFIKAKFGENAYQDFSASDMGKILFETFAFVGDTLSWYQDFKASENFLLTANLRKNIARIAYQLAYKIGKASPARAMATLTLRRPYTFPVTVPQGFQFMGGQLIYELQNSVTFPAGETTLPDSEKAKASLVEGERRTMIFTSDGSSNQQFSLTAIPQGKFLARGYTEVYVDGTLWTEVDFWSFENREEYIISYEDDPPTLRFGDQRVAKVPLAGQTIKVVFRFCSGAAGNVLAGVINKAVMPIIVLGQAIEIQCTNAERAQGGTDAEATEHIRALAPRYFLTKDRAVSKDDIELLVANFQSTGGLVASKVRAVSLYDCMSDSTLASLLNRIVTEPAETRAVLKMAIIDYLNSMLTGGRDGNVMKLLVLMKDGNGNYIDPDSGYLSELTDYLLTRKIPTVRFVGEKHPTAELLRHASMTVYAKCSPQHNRDTVKATIAMALESMFSNLEFGNSLMLSDIYAIIEALDGVVWSNVVFADPAEDGVIKDAYGNLIINSDLLFVPGTIDITVEKSVS